MRNETAIATSLEVDFITSVKTEAASRVTHIGGRALDGSTWMFPAGDAIQMIEKRLYEFRFSFQGERLKVVVGADPAGQRYLKGEGDLLEPIRLLSLRQR